MKEKTTLNSNELEFKCVTVDAKEFQAGCSPEYCNPEICTPETKECNPTIKNL